MKQKGFATIFGLCLALVFALIVKGIQEAETNHAREVSNFQLEQALQNAAYGGILEAAEFVNKNPDYLPFDLDNEIFKVQKKIPVDNATFKNDEQTIQITVEVWGERGKIYFYKKKIVNGQVKSTEIKDELAGVYFMSLATIKSGFWDEKIYRRAYAYVLDNDTTIYFMELPTQYGNIVTK